MWWATTYPKPVDNSEYNEQLNTLKANYETQLAANNNPGTYMSEIETLELKMREEELTNSIMGRLGRFLEPIFSPMGYDWKLVTASLGALAAKEVFVAQLGIVYSVGESGESSSNLRQKLAENWNRSNRGGDLFGSCNLP